MRRLDRTRKLCKKQLHKKSGGILLITFLHVIRLYMPPTHIAEYIETKI